MRKNLLWAVLAMFCRFGYAQNLGDMTIVHVPVNGDYNDFGPGYLQGTAHGGISYSSDNRGNTNQALLFDGTDDYISFGDPSVYHKPLPVSFSFWVYLDDNTGNYPVFATDNTSTAYAGIIVSIASGTVHMNYGDGVNFGTGNRSTLSSATKLNAGKWYHIAGVIRGYHNMDMYIDGNKETNGTYSGSGTPNAMGYVGSGLSIGMYSKKGNGSDQYFKGRIDDLHIWNRELNQNEVIQKKNALLVYSFIPGGQLEDSGPGGVQGQNTDCAGTSDRYERGGQSIYLNGNTSRVGLPQSAVYKQTFPLTLSAWVKISSQKFFQPIITTSDHATNKYSGVTLYLENGKPAITCGDNAGAGIQFRRSLVSPDSVKVGRWYQITAVCSSLTDWKLYVNGTQINGAVASGTGTAMVHAGGSGFLGYLTDAFGGSNRYFHGYLDEVMISGSALSNKEVNALYKAGLVIQSFSDDTTITELSSFQLKVTANSEDTILYQWQKRKSRSEAWQNIASAKQAVFEKSSATANDTGDYRCILDVNNFSDTTSHAHVSFTQLNKAGGGEVSEVVLSPNPAEGLIQITGFSGKIKWCIYDAQGKKQLSGQLADETTIDVSTLKAGVYNIEIKTGNKVFTTKFIIK